MSRLCEAEENSKAGNTVSDQPIVVYDGILMKCSISKNAYVPEESINIEDLVVLLREGLLNPQSPVGCPQEKRKTSVFTSPMFDRTPYKAFYKPRLRSDGESESDEFQITTSRRKESTTSTNGIPNSVLLRMTPKPRVKLDSVFEEIDDAYMEEKLKGLKERLMDQIDWVKEQGEDYVALETLDSIEEIILLLGVFMSSKTPAALGFKINHNSTITVSYQFLHNFKNDFMMLKVDDKYCVFISPF